MTRRDGAALGDLRVRLALSVLSLALMALGVGAMVAGVVLHSSVALRLGVINVAVLTALTAVREALRTRLALKLGRWIGFNGAPIDRVERPVRFWIQNSLSVAGSLISAVAAAALGYLAIWWPQPF